MMPVSSQHIGQFYNQPVQEVTLSNQSGMSVSILTLGGIIRCLHVPDSDGEVKDIVLGYDNLADYAKDTHYMGAIIGRVANRIEGAKFNYNGETIQVDRNAYDGKHCVHGGRFGYHHRVWQIAIVDETDDEISLWLLLEDADGEEGFKGNITVSAKYTLTSTNQLRLDISACSDTASPMSMTAHSYFNLNGHESGSINNHLLRIPSDRTLQQKQDRIPNGEVVSVRHTAFDYSLGMMLAECVNNDIDINDSYVLSEAEEIRLVGELQTSKLGLRVYSNEDTLHFYNGHNLNQVAGKNTSVYQKFAGVCLEPKGYVNAVNIGHFPLSQVTPDKPYQHSIVYEFYYPDDNKSFS
ncbi:aldose epimerase family protein [Vibrio maritimus]|uniref:aldose epimerase family protein n=1 Tax=Vibrio maritimus TaxID=990268 RepID=UPI003734F66F